MTSTEVRVPFLEGLRTVPEHSKEDVEHVRQWLTHMPHLPQMSDDHIHLFLHCNYGRMERTKKTIDNYFTMRTHAPELFSNLNPLEPTLQTMLNYTLSAPTPAHTSEGYTVWYNKLTESDPKKFDLVSMLKMFFMLGDTLISEQGLSPGIVAVFDMKGVSIGHLACINISVVRTFMNFIQEASPVRMKSIHVVNAVPFMDRVMMLIKPFMNAELVDLLHIHGSIDELAQLFPLETIPRDYGGSAEELTVLHAQYRKLMETKYRPFLQQMSTLKVDETKRPVKTGEGQKLFGAEGSFRTLSID